MLGSSDRKAYCPGNESSDNRVLAFEQEKDFNHLLPLREVLYSSVSPNLRSGGPYSFPQEIHFQHFLISNFLQGEKCN